MDSLLPFPVALLLAFLAGALVVFLVYLRVQKVQSHNKNRLEYEVVELNARVGHLQEQLSRQEQQCQSEEQENQQLRTQLSELKTSLARTEEREKALEKTGKQMETMLHDSRNLLKTEFEGLAGRIFEERSRTFQKQNQENMNSMLRPFKQQITDFRQRVDEIHTQDSRDRASLRERIHSLQELNKQMHTDALNLTSALKGQVKAQGNWGEMILERVFEESGLRKGHEYETQVSFKDEQGHRKQPDAIVHLPEGKDVIVDAKVSLVAYERYHVAETDEDKNQALSEHIQSIRAHIHGLSGKEYASLPGVRSLDFVLLFVPVEAAFMIAMDNDPDLYQQAYEKNIVLVSPTTLLVTLRTIQNIWRYEYQNKNAMDIADRAGKICDQVVLIEEALDDVGSRLGQAHDSWEQAHKRLVSGRGNLLGQAHKLQSLGAKAKKALPELEDDTAVDSVESSSDS